MIIAEIGMPRTGTRSLATAMQKLGYTVSHGIRGRHEVIPEILHGWMFGDCDFPFYKNYDFIGNMPNIHWRQLVEKHPDAKYILTVRDGEKWIESCWNRWKRVFRWRSKKYLAEGISNDMDMMRLLSAFLNFGCMGINKELWLQKFYDHNLAVIQYFVNSEQFLVIDICGGEGWEKLCPFLGKPIPEEPFPNTKKFSNKARR